MTQCITPAGCSPVLLALELSTLSHWWVLQLRHYVGSDVTPGGASCAQVARVLRYALPSVVPLRVWLCCHERVWTTQALQLFNLLLDEQHPETQKVRSLGPGSKHF